LLGDREADFLAFTAGFADATLAAVGRLLDFADLVFRPVAAEEASSSLPVSVSATCLALLVTPLVAPVIARLTFEIVLVLLAIAISRIVSCTNTA
jgi:hypothetical protein